MLKLTPKAIIHAILISYKYLAMPIVYLAFGISVLPILIEIIVEKYQGVKDGVS